MSPCQPTRRNWLQITGGAAGACLLGDSSLRAAPAPATRVTVAKCKTYSSSEVVRTLDKMFDELGGLGRIVKGKTVAIKVNLTGAPTYRLGYLPAEDTHYTHPQVIGATVHLLGKAGACGSSPRTWKSFWCSWKTLATPSEKRSCSRKSGQARSLKKG